MISITQLLLHSVDVPAPAREALRAAFAAPAPERDPLLRLAARSLHLDAQLDCSDALELVGLDAEGC